MSPPTNGGVFSALCDITEGFLVRVDGWIFGIMLISCQVELHSIDLDQRPFHIPLFKNYN